MIQLYEATDAEKQELSRLETLYKNALLNYSNWSNHAEDAKVFLTSTAMSNFAKMDREKAMNAFQQNNSWFTWFSWFNPIPVSSDGNLNRTAYINYCYNVRDNFDDEVIKTRHDWQLFQDALDAKNKALIDLQTKAQVSADAVEAQKQKTEQTKLITDNIPLIVISVVLLAVVGFYLYKKFKK